MSKKFPKNFNLKIKAYKKEFPEFIKTQESFGSRASTESINNLYTSASTIDGISSHTRTRKLNFNRRIQTMPSVDDYLQNQKLFRTWKCL